VELRDSPASQAPSTGSATISLSCSRLLSTDRTRPAENALNIPNLALVKMETAALLTPTKLWTRTEVLARPCPVPASAGVYAWFFDSCPQGVPTEGLVRSVGLALLYVGISPKPPSIVGTRAARRSGAGSATISEETQKVLPYGSRSVAFCRRV
jgi:hypothetical protein